MTVDDNVLGDVGSLGTLQPGQQGTLTADYVLTDSALVVANAGTVSATDALGRSVSATSHAQVSVVMGEPPVTSDAGPVTPTELPYTGGDVGFPAVMGFALVLLGLPLVVGRRHRAGAPD